MAHQYYNIQPAELSLAPAKTLANDTLDPVPVHGPFQLALRRGDAQTGMGEAIRARQQGKIPITLFDRLCEYAAEILGGKQAVLAWKSPVRSLRGRVVRGDRRVRDQALKRWRPLARRALITARPARVRMRARKP